MEYNFQIGNKRLFVEVLGSDNAPALLYIHGGPGTGSYDFKQLQGEALSKRCRIVMVDQRGVLRSQHLDESDSLDPQDIINDFEEIRTRLGIESWTILGHSFGGYLALLYIKKYPKAIEKVIFECPSFDLALASCSLLKRAAEEFREIGDYNNADECEKSILSYKDTKEIWYKLNLLNNLGERRNNIYVYHQEKDFFQKLIKGSGLEEAWEGYYLHQVKLDENGSIYKSNMPLLSEIKCKALLITGKFDYVTSQEQIEAFESRVASGKIIQFEQSGHFPRFEEADLYSKTVLEFILD